MYLTLHIVCTQNDLQMPKIRVWYLQFLLKSKLLLPGISIKDQSVDFRPLNLEAECSVCSFSLFVFSSLG